MNLKKILIFTLALVLFISSAVFAYQQSSVMRKKVEEGELPPLEERLPEEPMIVPIDEERGIDIGQYGGILQMFLSVDYGNFQYEPLVKYSAEELEPIPNVARDWSVSDDSKTFTFHIRKGIRWSDGKPLTAEDIVFGYKDLILNSDYTPEPPAWTKRKGVTGEIRTPDEYTVIFEFTAPHPIFLKYLNNYYEQNVIQPKHYLQQFHPDYTTEDELKERIKKGGFDSWDQLMEQKINELENPEKPVIYSFQVTTDPQALVQEARPNPYYWKVDPEGNQLPYLKGVRWEDIQEEDVRALKVTSGEIDLGYRFIVNKYPLLHEGQSKGDYKLHLLPVPCAHGISLHFNQNYQGDEEIAELLRNVKFRRAISLAINREEINEFTQMGLGEEGQIAIDENDPAYVEGMKNNYAEHNPEKASEMLDEIGLDKRNESGYRLLPGGKKLLLPIAGAADTSWDEVAEIVASQLDKVGIDVNLNIEEVSLNYERVQSGEQAITAWPMNGGDTTDVALIRINWWVPLNSLICQFAPLNAKYYATDGENGVKPEGDIAKLLEINEDLKYEPDPQKLAQLFKEVAELHKKNLWIVGTATVPGWPLVISNRLHNVPTDHGQRIIPATWT